MATITPALQYEVPPPHTPTPSNPAPINHLGFKIFTCCLPVSVTTFRGPALSSGPLLGRVTGGLPAPAHPLYCLVTSAVRRRLLSNSQGPTTSASLLKYAVLRTEVKVFDWFDVALIHHCPDLKNKAFPLDFPWIPKLISLCSAALEVQCQPFDALTLCCYLMATVKLKLNLLWRNQGATAASCP